MSRFLRPRTLRARLAWHSAVAAFGCTLVAGAAVYAATAGVIGRLADAQLRQVTEIVAPAASSRPLAGDGTFRQICAANLAGEASSRLGGRGSPTDQLVVELVGPDGTRCPLAGPDIREVTATPAPLRLLLGTDLPQATDAEGRRLMVLQRPVADGWQVWVARDMTHDYRVLYALRGVMIILSLAGGLVALVAGSLVSRTALRPIGRLAETAEQIARTEDLSVRVEVPDRGEDDEITRLARAFDRMTSALAASRHRQAQLVADAGHELRTPLTSLRTNIDLLVRSERTGRALRPEQRAALLEDVRTQLEELSRLTGELTELAGPEIRRPTGPVRLDDVVTSAVERARPRARGRTIDLTTEPWVVPDGDAGRLERAIVNVLDNAVKFSPEHSTIRVRQRQGVVVIDDAGPGIPPEHREDALARFWRGDDARSQPGSGLGLAIVADAVERHGGTVRIAEAPAGGTRVVMLVPGRAPTPEDTPSENDPVDDDAPDIPVDAPAGNDARGPKRDPAGGSSADSPVVSAES